MAVRCSCITMEFEHLPDTRPCMSDRRTNEWQRAVDEEAKETPPGLGRRLWRLDRKLTNELQTAELKGDNCTVEGD